MKIRIFVVLIDDASPRCALFATEWGARHWLLVNAILPTLPSREGDLVSRAFLVDSREIIREFLPRLDHYDIIRWEGDLPLLSMTISATLDAGRHLAARTSALLARVSPAYLNRKGH